MANTQDPPLNELLTRSMVDIYVGPENTHWILHEKLLCHRSKFFRNIFSSKEGEDQEGEDKKGDDQSFGLPDEENEPFQLFVGWLYSGAVPKPREEKDLGQLFELYLMAEKWAIRGLVYDVLDSVRTFYHDTDSYPALRRVQYIYANTELESPMRQLLVGSIARYLVLKNDGMPPQWDKALRRNGQMAVDLIICVQKWNLQKDSVPDPRAESVEPIMEESEQAKDAKDESNEDGEQDEEEQEDGEEEEKEEQDGEEQDDEQQSGEEAEEAEDEDKAVKTEE